MKKRRILGIIISSCLLFSGCGVDNENTDVSPQESQREEAVTESSLESGTDTEQAVENAGSEIEKSAEDAEKEESAGMVVELSEVLEGYGAFLAEYESYRMGNNSEEVPGFALIYLDSDDVPELIVMEGSAHACGGYVYTFEEGEVIPVGEGYGQYGAMWYREKEGIVFHDYDAFGNVYCDVYQIEGKKETHLQSYSERYELPEEGEGMICTYIVDGNEVSEEQYRKVCDKWNKTEDKMIQYDDCRTLTDGDIQSSLTEELENLILTQEKY